MLELTHKTITELREGFRAGEFSAREIAEAFNAAVVAGHPLNAYTVETPELALEAASLDQVRVRPRDLDVDAWSMHADARSAGWGN